MARDAQLFGSPCPGDEAHDLQFDQVALGAGEGAGEGAPLSTLFVDTWDPTLCSQDGEKNDMEYLFDFAEAGPSSTTLDLVARAPLEVSAPRRLDVAALTNKLESKLSYAIDRIKDAPITMLLESETPWCHALLYRDQMPRAMQGEFGLPFIRFSTATTLGLQI